MQMLVEVVLQDDNGMGPCRLMLRAVVVLMGEMGGHLAKWCRRGRCARCPLAWSVQPANFEALLSKVVPCCANLCGTSS